MVVQWHPLHDIGCSGGWTDVVQGRIPAHDDGMDKASEKDLAPWKLSLNQIQWPFRLADLKDWPAAEKRAELAIGALLKRFPHCQYINLFHESYDPRVYPPEIFGEKHVTKDEALSKREDELFELGVKAAKFIRAKFPSAQDHRGKQRWFIRHDRRHAASWLSA